MSAEFEKAIDQGNVILIKELINNGKINIFTWKNEHRSNALQLACYQDQPEIVGILLDHGMDIECGWFTENSRTFHYRPLRIACNQGNTAIGRLLLERGAKLSLESMAPWSEPSLRPLIYEAIYKKHTDFVRLLIDYKVDLNNQHLPNARYSSPLHAACLSGDKDIVSVLLSSGADVNCKDDKGCIPLHYACKFRELDIIKFLLDNSYVDFTIVNNNGQTASDYFGIQEGTGIDLRHRLLQLTRLHCGISEKLPENMSVPEFLLLIKKHTEGIVKIEIISEAMKKYQFNIRHKNEKNGETLLFPACRAGYPTVVHWLLQREPYLVMESNLSKQSPENVSLPNADGAICKRLILETKRQILGIYSLALTNNEGKPKYPTAGFFYLAAELKQAILEYGVGSVSENTISLNSY